VFCPAQTLLCYFGPAKSAEKKVQTNSQEMLFSFRWFKIDGFVGLRASAEQEQRQNTPFERGSKSS
jgi:hypothetical protein